ncbi:VOC family protein [Luteimonas sp. A611]
MSRRGFVNFPVRDLDVPVRFFTALGFDFNPEFTDANATCMVVSDDIFVMLPLAASLPHARDSRPGPAAGDAPCNDPPPRIEPAPAT